MQLEKEPIHDEGYLVYRILDTLTDALFPVIAAIEDAHRHARGRGAAARPPRAAADDLPAAPGRPRAAPARARPSASVFRRPRRRSAASPASATARRSPPRRRRPPHQIAGELHRQNDDLLSLTQTYFNANADRLNAVATRLTVVGTIFVVWTLVTGFFGQNFGWLVEQHQPEHDFLLFGVGGLVVPT